MDCSVLSSTIDVCTRFDFCTSFEYILNTFKEANATLLYENTNLASNCLSGLSIIQSLGSSLHDNTFQ